MLVDPNNAIYVDNEIYLKPINISNLEDLYNLTKKNKKELIKWFDWADNRQTLKSSLSFIQKSIRGNENGTRCDLGIFYNSQLVGMFGLINVDKEERTVEFAYWVSIDFQGKGIITRSCKKMEDYVFNVLDYSEIFIIVLAENAISRKIPEKLGFEICDADKKPTRMNKQKSYYLYYSKFHADYKNNFWQYLTNIFKSSEVVIDCKAGKKIQDLNNEIAPVNYGHLKNDWAKDEELTIWIGSDEKQHYEINTIVCMIDIKNKFCDISLLINCTSNEKKQVFNILKKTDGVLLVEK